MRLYNFALFLLAGTLAAQKSASRFRLVLPSGPGAITITPAEGWKLESLRLYDDGPRVSLFLTNEKASMGASYLMFANDTKDGPTAESCRDSVMGPVVEGTSKQTKLTNIKQETYTAANGRTLAVASHFIEKIQGHPIHQQNVFAFIGDPHNCTEVHISKVGYTPADDALFHALLDAFTYDENYQPKAVDYGPMANIFYEAHNLPAAIMYYRPTLDHLEDGSITAVDTKTMRRVLTDQLVMAYGMSGDLKRSREAAQAAIARDPDYPMYYYNLACADAEEGNAAAARQHLQQAFDRRANTLKGEMMPDPTKDDSFLKLKSNKEFWAFVQSLPKQ